MANQRGCNCLWPTESIYDLRNTPLQGTFEKVINQLTSGGQNAVCCSCTTYVQSFRRFSSIATQTDCESTQLQSTEVKCPRVSSLPVSSVITIEDDEISQDQGSGPRVPNLPPMIVVSSDDELRETCESSRETCSFCEVKYPNHSKNYHMKKQCKLYKCYKCRKEFSEKSRFKKHGAAAAPEH